MGGLDAGAGAAPGGRTGPLERAAAAIDAALTPDRVRRFSALLLAAHIAITVVAIPRGRWPLNAFGDAVLSDLVAHVTGAELVLSGRTDALYDPAAQQALEIALTGNPDYLNLYLSPPFVALLYAPLARLPYWIAVLAWTAITLALLAAAAHVARPLLPALARERWGTVLLAAAGTQPIIENLGTGQDAAISVLLWMAGARLALSRRDIAAGVVLGLGAFKPQLFILPPLLLAALRRPRAVAAVLATAGGLAALSLALVGPRGIASWVSLLGSPLYVDGIRATWRWKMHSAAPFLEALVPDALTLTARAAGLIAGAGIVVATAVAVARRRGGDERLAWALGGTATAFASPHLFIHDLALVLFPAALLLDLGASRRTRLVLAGLAVLTWTAPVRYLLIPEGWPARMLAASWAPPLLWLLWRDLRAALARSAPP